MAYGQRMTAWQDQWQDVWSRGSRLRLHFMYLGWPFPHVIRDGTDTRVMMPKQQSVWANLRLP